MRPTRRSHEGRVVMKVIAKTRVYSLGGTYEKTGCRLSEFGAGSSREVGPPHRMGGCKGKELFVTFGYPYVLTLINECLTPF